MSIAAPDDDERHHRPPYRAFDGTPPPSPTPEVTPFAGGALATTTSPARYIVRSGDTLSGIAARFGMTVDTLVFINRLPARNYIWPGEVLAIADASSTPTPLPVEADPTPTLAPVEISPTLTPLPIADAPVTPTQPPTVAPDRQADLLPQAAEVIVEFGHYPWGTPHYGLDLQAPSGTAVTAPVGGVVVEVTTGCVVGAVTCGNGWGNHVWWRSALTEHYLLVAHFTAISVGLAPGVAITAGTLLGYSGTTGYSTGPHVHIQTSASGPDDASAFDPSLELPWETCGHTPPHLGDAWGSTTGCY